MQHRPEFFSPVCAHLLWLIATPCFFDTQHRVKLGRSWQVQNIGNRCVGASDTSLSGLGSEMGCEAACCSSFQRAQQPFHKSLCALGIENAP